MKTHQLLGVALLLGATLEATASAQTPAAAAPASPAPSPAGPPKVTVQVGGKEATLTLGGLLQVQGDAGDRGDSRFSSDNSRFYLRRARLTVNGTFLEHFDFRLESDLAGSLAETSNLRAQLTDAFVTWNQHEAAKVRFGQFKSPYGHEQLVGDLVLPTIERTLVNDRLTPGRQIGVQLGGDLLDKHLNYSAGVFNGTGTNTTANDNNELMWAGRLIATPYRVKVGDQERSWSIAANAFTSEDTALALAPDFGFDSTPATAARDNLFTGKRTGIGLDSQLELGRFTLWLEYLAVGFDPDNALPAASFDAEGGHVMVAWMAIPDKLQLLARADTFDPNDRRDGNKTDSALVGLTWFIKGHNLKLVLNALRSEIENGDTQDKLLARFQVGF